jgi:hypothetical protein
MRYSPDHLSKIDCPKKKIGLSRYIMVKEELIEIIHGIPNTDIDLSFLLQLEKSELEKLLATIRDRVEQAGE